MKRRQVNNMKMALIGGAIGTGIALLFAPKKGSELRSDINKDLNNLLQKASEKGQKLSNQAEHLADDLVNRAENILNLSKDFVNGKYKGSTHVFTNEYNKLRKAFNAAMDTYRNFSKNTPRTEEMVDNIFDEYEDETLPKFQGMGRRQDIDPRDN